MASTTTAAPDAAHPEEPQQEQQPQPQPQPQDNDDEEAATESTPLLPTTSDPNASQQKPHPLLRRWPSLLALLLLCLLAILIMVFAFFAPSLLESYARQALIFDPQSLSIDSFTPTGVRARVRGDFMLDSSRVKDAGVRRVGRAGMWVAGQAETGEGRVEVSLPELGGTVLGTAWVPGVVVSLRDGRRTAVDVVVEVEAGETEGIRRVVGDFVDGRLGRVRVRADAEVSVKSGVVGLGVQRVREEVVVEEGDVPAVPDYDIVKINVHEVQGEGKGMEADVSVSAINEYPVDFEVPPLAFQVLVDNCAKSEPYIHVGDAKSSPIYIHPRQNVIVNATGLVRKLPKPLTQDCPDTKKSPLDVLVSNYISGRENTIYIRGDPNSSPDTPQWITDLISDIMVPVPLPGRTPGHLIKNFSLEDTHFSLPNPFAEPGAPDAQPRISAKVNALVALPGEMNFNLSARRVRADADVFYKGEKLGKLDLHKWQQASSSRTTDDDGAPALLVQSKVDKAPLRITNEDLFTDVIQDMLFGGKSVVMQVQADVDVEVETALGGFKVRGIPAKGNVVVKEAPPSHPPGHGGGDSGDDDPKNHTLALPALHPKILDLRISNSTPSSLSLAALLNLTNPTSYSATIPLIDLLVAKNGSTLGHIIIRDVEIMKGVNPDVTVGAVYDPLAGGGETARAVGRELLSQYISGFNTTLTIRTWEGSIPGLPRLGERLGREVGVEVPVPHLGVPGQGKKDPDDGDGDDDDDDPDDDGDEGQDDRPHFITSTTLHLLTSTATFTLRSPLRHSTLSLSNLSAHAFYHDNAVGTIAYEPAFAVPPVGDDGEGVESPRLPVEWELGGVGYGAVKRALGGTLRVRAEAEVVVGVERFREEVWFVGQGVGVKVRL